MGLDCAHAAKYCIGLDLNSPGSFGGDRDSRPPRADVPFPTQPPYTAFVGNLSFECGQDEIRDFFAADGLTVRPQPCFPPFPADDTIKYKLKVSNVRMVNDFSGKPKGFCYAEFPGPEMLQKALDLTGTTLAGRNVRVSVAEPRA